MFPRISKAAIAMVALVVVLVTALAYQSFRVVDLQRQLTLISKQRREAPPMAPVVVDDGAPPFAKSVRKTIPDMFWGEFAEDVHDCGSAQSFVVTDRKLMVKEDEQETVEEVRWLKPKLISLSTRADGFLQRSYEMELSSDSNEITFIFTNMKVIRQRCSARAHEPPSEPLVENIDMTAVADMNAIDTTE